MFGTISGIWLSLKATSSSMPWCRLPENMTSAATTKQRFESNKVAFEGVQVQLLIGTNIE